MTLKFKVSDERVDANLVGELDTPATIELQSQFDKLAENASKEIVIDCSELSYIASSGLRQIITLHKKCSACGGHLRLVNVTPAAMEIFTVTNFDKIFDIA